jgi:hypothetical protein
LIPKTSSQALWLWIAVFIAFIAYTSPWVVNRISGLTFNSYDLAEWASLHPEVRATPFLITSLLLRIQGTWFAVIIAVNAPRPILTRGWWTAAILVALIAVALLPPLEFFFEARGDGNYQQQFAIVVFTLTVGFIGLSRVGHHWRWRITMGAALLGVLTSGVGLAQGITLLNGFAIRAQLGVGGVLLMIVYVLILIGILYRVQKNRQGGTSLRTALLKAT